MVMKQTLLILMIGGVLGISTVVGADRFDAIKELLTQAKCTRFEFLSIIESEVFDKTDSVMGAAYIAGDGRYHVVVGGDRYLFDGNNLYSYSAENNQVVIEKVAQKEQTSREISFITHLDEFYEVYPIKPDSSYRLVKKTGVKGDMPDSATVFIAPRVLQIKRLEYYDVNEERTVILFLKQETDTVCNEEQFKPAFPDSVEKVRL